MRPDPAIRDAATLIVVRDAATRPRILMGQRAAAAAFMPSRMVFPGGAVDAADARVPLDLDPVCAAQLAQASAPSPQALAAAAIRELWEETGLVLGRPGDFTDPPPGWEGFAASGHVPDATGLSYIFRALTPPGRPRRFDARFLLVDAARIASDPDDFRGAEDELSHLGWRDFGQIRAANLPFITEIVLAEVAARLPDLGPIEAVPFFRNDDEASLFTRLRAG